ncbi:MAG: PEGA domain-containing protein [Deltaproteobacteria bacterium]|nr:PEGA domain-containing protein [Deltaproteobacteria bacterium]
MKSPGRFARGVALAGALAGMLAITALAAAGCKPQYSYVDIPARDPEGLIRVEANLPGARIYVDDFLAGTVAQVRRRGVPVQPGVRRIELRQDGYHSHYQLVTVVKGSPVTVRAQLLPVLE